jgi:peptide deformylase
VTCHECDHLEGILYPQRMDNLQDLIFETEARHWGSARPSEAETA